MDSNVKQAKFIISDDGKKVVSGGRDYSWRSMSESLNKGDSKTKILVFQHSMDGSSDDNLSKLLDFTLFVIQAYDTKNISIYLNIITHEDNLEANRNKVRNFYKCLDKYGKILTVKINGNKIKFNEKSSQITHTYLPSIVIDLHNVETIFSNTVEQFATCDFSTSGIKIKTNISQEYNLNYLAYLVSDSLNPNSSRHSNLRIIIEKYLMKTDIFTAYLACVLYRQNKIKYISNPDAVKEFSEYFNRAYIYSLGIKEIIENIIKHTEKKLGLVYFRIHKKRQLTQLQVDKSYECYFNELTANVREDCMTFVEIVVKDAGFLGITDTFQKITGNKKTLDRIFNPYENEYFRIEDFKEILTNQNSSKKLSEVHELANLLFHKGIKIFNNHIKESNGWFNVSTCVDYLHTVQYSDFSKQRINSDLVNLENPSLGTTYRIILPVLKNKNSYFERFLTPDSSAYFRGIPEGTSHNDEIQRCYKECNISILNWEKEKVEDLISNYNCTEDYNEDTCCKFILDLLRCLPIKNDMKGKVLLVDFCNIVSINKGSIVEKLIYFLVIVFSKHDFDYLALYNLNDRIISNFVDSYNLLIKIDLESKNPKVDFCYPWVFMYNNRGDLRVIRGVDSEKNKAFQSYFNYSRILNNNELPETLGVELSASEKKSVLFPIEILQIQKEKPFDTPIFLQHLKNVLCNSTGISNFGIRHNEHVRLGSKLHVDDFFQAEILFKNSYYTDCISNILARDITMRGNFDKNIVLVGYKLYSEMLIRKVKLLIEKYIKLNNIKKVKIITTIFYEEEALFEKEMQTIDQSLLDNAQFINIVPISSTLKTFIKIHANIELFLLKTKKIRMNDSENYSVIVIRDVNSEGSNDIYNRSSIERDEFNWDRFDPYNQIIKIKEDYPYENQTKEIRYVICEKTRWRLATDCEICNSNSNPLLITETNSLKLSSYDGLPFNKVNNNDFWDQKGIHQDDITLSKSVYIGHTCRNSNHFQYYIDTHNLFKKLDDKILNEWGKHVIKKLGKGATNILLVPEHFSNIEFAEWVFENLFEGNGIVIREDFSNEFYSNFLIKYKSIIMSRNVNYFFIDDELNSGKTFIKTISLFANNEIAKDQISIITLINGLDYQNYKMLKLFCNQCISLFNVYIPLIKEQTGDCWLCSELDNIEQLEINSNTSQLRTYLTFKKKELEVLEISGVTQTPKEMYKKLPFIENRFQLLNRIYFELYKIQGDKGVIISSELVKTILGVSNNNRIKSNILTNKNILNDFTKESISYKINFIKLLTTPFLSNFNILVHIAFEVSNAELNAIMNFEIGENINPSTAEDNIKYLTVLVKRQLRLSNRYIISNEGVEKIFKFFLECIKRIKNDSYRKSIKFLDGFKYSLYRAAYSDPVFAYLINKNFINIFINPNNEALIIEFARQVLLENENILRTSAEFMFKDMEKLEEYRTNNTDMTNDIESLKIVKKYYYRNVVNLIDLFLENSKSLYSNPSEEVEQKNDNTLKTTVDLLHVINNNNEEIEQGNRERDFTEEVANNCRKAIKAITGNGELKSNILIYENFGNATKTQSIRLYSPTCMLAPKFENESSLEVVLKNIFSKAKSSTSIVKDECFHKEIDCKILKKEYFINADMGAINIFVNNEGNIKYGLLILFEKLTELQIILLYKTVSLIKNNVYDIIKKDYDYYCNKKVVPPKCDNDGLDDSKIIEHVSNKNDFTIGMEG